MRNLFWGFILILFGVLFLLDNLGYADFSEIIHDYWPLILVLWGISILMRRRSVQDIPPTQTAQSPIPPPVSAPHSSIPPPPADLGTSTANDLVHQSNVFGDVYTRIVSQNFKGGSVSTVFGDLIVDLSAIVIAESDHELKLHSVFGDTTVILPRDAAIAVSGSSVFGSLTVLGQHKSGFSNDLYATSPSFETQTRRLKINVGQVFGDVRVN